jgi:YidC/Oxa1 family membrane protein insertase
MGAIWSAFVGIFEQLILYFSTLTGSVGFGIIIFTILARIVILPLTLRALKSSRRMQELQPQIKELQRKHGKEPQKLQEETMKLYRENKVNPVGGCLPLLLQLPIFIGVYQAVYHLMVVEQRVNLSDAAKVAMQDPAIQALFSQPFLGVIDLGVATFGGDGFAGPIYVIMPILSVVMQLAQQLMATPRVQDPQQKAMTQAMLFMPLVFGYIAFTFPTGAVLYWVTSSVIGVVQQYFTSGWGSLANYLKFLPPDGKPSGATLTPAVAGAAVGSESSIGSAPATTAPARDFWSVMRPLTETDARATGAAEEEPEASATTEEQAIQQVRRQTKTSNNPRRTRRRR